MLQALASAETMARQDREQRQPHRTDGAERLMPASVTTTEMAALNAFYRRRGKARITVAGDKAEIAARWPATDAAEQSLCAIGVTVGAKGATLQLPLRAVERLLAKAEVSADLSKLAPRHAALLLEAVLADDLERLEGALGEKIEFISIKRSAAPPPTTPFALALSGDGQTTECTFFAEDAVLAVRMARLLDEAGASLPVPADFPLLVCLRRDALTITLGMLRSLQPDDVILLGAAEKDRTAAIIVAERFFAPVRLTAAGPQLLAAPAAIAGSNWEWTMDQKTPPSGQTLEESSLDELPVALAFEVGRTVMPLGDVRQLAPGAIVAFPDAVEETVDIMANGKRVGRGEVVRVGDHLGVRILRMFDNG